MSMLWRDVFVPAHVVSGDGLTAEVDGVTELPLALFCRYRAYMDPQDSPASVTPVLGGYPYPIRRRVHDLVGSVVAVDDCLWPDGWMIDVNGLGIYVSEAGASPVPGPRTVDSVREVGSDPPIPVPQAGSWVRIRGELSIAEAYETEVFEPMDELLGRAVRQWQVRRIVRLDIEMGASGSPSQGHSHDVTVMRFVDVRHGEGWMTMGYSLDLEQASNS